MTASQDLGSTPRVHEVKLRSGNIEDFLETSALEKWTDGAHRFLARGRYGAKVETWTELIPAGGEAIHCQLGSAGFDLVITGPDYRARVQKSVDGTVVLVSAQSEGRLRELHDWFRATCDEPPATDTVVMDLWSLTSLGRPVSRRRRVAAVSWSELHVNYPLRTRHELDTLMSLSRPVEGMSGRLLLWHGVPGTGKTTALKALAASWSGWCDTAYVIDSQRFFADPNYLLDVVTRGDHGSDEPRWQLVIAEDCDAYLRGQSGNFAADQLGMLLNLCDGILGQGMRTLVALTTNVEVGRLHRAMTRPGRCLSQLEFEVFTPEEAATWLGSEFAEPATPLTLAELFAHRNGVAVIAEPRADVGQYL